jgi:hypothetical protein
VARQAADEIGDQVRAQVLRMLMRHVGTEIVVSAYSNEQLNAEFRVPATAAQLTTDDLERIRAIYLTKLAAVPGAL